MNANVLILPKINLLEKKYLASRIACLVLTVLLVMYLLPIPTRGLMASLISGGLAVLLTIPFIFQSRIANIVLGGIMFLIGAYFSLTVVSEFNEFETLTRAAWQLLLFGLGGCFSVMFLSFLMLRRAVLDGYTQTK